MPQSLVNDPAGPSHTRIYSTGPHSITRYGLWLGAAVLFLMLGVSSVRAQKPPVVAPPKPATPIMRMDEVRIGMKGYGLSVFQGRKIEPFPVEVISVMHNFAPQRGAVWIRCPDQRMQQSGPVQGMSGSPIYLWDPQEEQTLGKGGRLIGAFAFGYSGSKDCYVGVQPIEYMLAAARHSADGSPASAPSTAPAAKNVAKESLATLLASPGVSSLPAHQRGLAQAVARLAGVAPSDVDAAATVQRPAPAAATSLPGTPRSMMLPLGVSSPGLASSLEGLLAPLGIAPFQTPPGLIAGAMPPGIEAKDISLEPGSVLAIPLAWGDMDLSASGTVTDVLPNGQVLAFGHAMFGQGPVALPMATGFVHLVMPTITTSFKLGGSAVIRGTIVRDENTAVVGEPGQRFKTLPVHVAVDMPGQPRAGYEFQVVQHKQFTPIIAAIVASESLTANQNFPVESTGRIQGTLTFAGGRKLQVDTLLTAPTPQAVLAQLMPPMTIMVQNPHESMMVESVDLHVKVEQGLRLATLATARLDQEELAPGQSVSLLARLQPFGKPALERRFELELPENLPEGDYMLQLCDGPTYLQFILTTHPHMLTTTSAQDVFSTLERMTSVANDALYMVLVMRPEGVAIGRQEFPQLPSSRRAMLTTPSSTVATEFVESLAKVFPMGMVTEGSLAFAIKVRKNAEQN